MNQKHTMKNYRKEQNYSNITMNYMERAAWHKEGGLSIEDYARNYVEKAAAENPCPISDERRAALDEAFRRVCADAGLTEEQAEKLVRLYDEA